MFNTFRKIALPSLVLSSFLFADSIESKRKNLDVSLPLNMTHNLDSIESSDVGNYERERERVTYAF